MEWQRDGHLDGSSRQGLERIGRRGVDVKVNLEQSIHLAGSNLGKHRHVCAFFHNQDQEDKVVVPFFKEGIDRGGKAFYVSYPQMYVHLFHQLSQAGIEVKLAEKRGQLEVKKPEEVYVRDGRFDQDAVLALIQEVLRKGAEQGFTLTRYVSRMEWAVKYRVGINELLEYEARLNLVLPNFRDPVICVYNLAQFKADVVVDILRTHPMVIIGKLMAKNPFFVPPDVFLQELSERRANTRPGTVRLQKHEQ
jgi:MEDS: MEthanogen/methylotroph, DcmR Sensory domain